MSSVSRTSSSLGNTALRGFGGLASGIDRDALIEQMTARTTSKITSKKQAMTKLEWKRDAYRSISNKIIDLQDNYLSYSATKSLKNSDFFAKNQVSVQGDRRRRHCIQSISSGSKQISNICHIDLRRKENRFSYYLRRHQRV